MNGILEKVQNRRHIKAVRIIDTSRVLIPPHLKPVNLVGRRTISSRRAIKWSRMAGEKGCQTSYPIVASTGLNIRDSSSADQPTTADFSIFPNNRQSGLINICEARKRPHAIRIGTKFQKRDEHAEKNIRSIRGIDIIVFFLADLCIDVRGGLQPLPV